LTDLKNFLTEIDPVERLRWIVENDLCTSCGTCAGICPTSAISMKKNLGIYVPFIDSSKCTSCGICLLVCPGYSVDFKMLNNQIFGNIPQNHMIGNFIESHIAYAKDVQIRKVSQSGGIITTLLIHALNENLIDGAIVTRMKTPFQPEVFIAKSEKEIISASKSKYCPIPLNHIIKKLSEIDGKYAYVGLPCHIHGIRKAEKKFKWLQDKILFHFGLICEGTLNYNFIDYLIFHSKIKKEDLLQVQYRDKTWRGWPGDISLLLKNGCTLNVSRECRLNSKPFFTPWRCYICSDKLNTLADISFGDAWLHSFSNESLGRSIIIIRKKQAYDLYKSAINKEKINSELIKIENILEAQNPQKKVNLVKQYQKISNLIKIKMPQLNISLNGKKPNPFSILGAFFNHFLYKISFNPFIKKMIYSSPPYLLKLITSFRNFLINI